MPIFDGNLPYTNLHELNNDWVVKVVKEVKDKTDEIDNSVESAKNYAEESKGFSELSEQIKEDCQDILSDTTDAVSGLSDEILAWQNDSSQMRSQLISNSQTLDLHTSQIDSIISGSTADADAELIDIRVRADGLTYPTAGDSVRGQVTQLKEQADLTQDIALMPLDITNLAPTMTRRFAINWQAKTINSAGSSFWISDEIPVNEGEIYRITASTYGATAVFAFSNAGGIQIVYPDVEPSSSATTIVQDMIVKVPTGMTGLYIENYTPSGVTEKLEKLSANLPSGAVINEYVGDFVTNKADNTAWVSGYGVYKIDLNAPRATAGYYLLDVNVTKGDLIKIEYQAGYPLSGAYVALSQKIAYGTGSLECGFRPLIYEGTGTIEYVAEKDMTVTVCGHDSSHLPTVEVYESKAYMESVDVSKDRYRLFDYNEIAKKLPITRKATKTNTTPLTLLHFSDIHNSFGNTFNIKEFNEKYGEFLNDIICTGDMAGTFYNYKPIFDLNGYQDIMLCIGNHDVYDADGTHNGSDDPDYWATNIQKYNKYIAPNVTNWGVVQPSNASSLGLCYYYKDYNIDLYNYRLIVLDAMAFDNAQYTWLVNTLLDARLNSKIVLIAEHFPPISSYGNINGFNTPFMSMLTGMEYNYNDTFLTTQNGSATGAVDDFINAGGEFVCWLCGHMHYDQIGTLTTHPNQIFIAIGTANSGSPWQDMPRIRETQSYDLFNLMSVDPVNKVIKIERIGATTDTYGRKHDYVSINYATKSLIATS